MRPAILRCLWVVAALLCLGNVTSAKVAVRVEFGWEWQYRPGRWTPVFFTISDDSARPARNVQLEIVTPQDTLFGMRILQRLAIHPEPTTYLAYVPLTYQIPDTIVIVRDAQTGRKLAEQSFERSTAAGMVGVYSYARYGQADLLIGLSGRRNALGILGGLNTVGGGFDWTDEPPAEPSGPYRPTGSVRLGFLEPARLPDAIVGYDALDILVLNAPDVVNMRPEQQEAIAGWVRGGGNLLLWLGEAPLPPDSALVNLLPCTVGEITAVPVSLDETKSLGIASRVERLAGRELKPTSWGKSTAILGGKATVCHGRVGLGRVGVLSIDGSQLAFEKRENAMRFWGPILKELVRPGAEAPAPQTSHNTTPDGRRIEAINSIADRLGDVPGVGTFDFSYIAIVMLGMMLIVGPVDWLVLKKLGRQPWTWATTAGWIALVTGGALYIGHVFRSGELHYRTLRVIDEADGKVVGIADATALYSPQTRRYEFDLPRDGWWKPAGISESLPWGQASQMPNEIPAVQDLRSNRLLGMRVNVWGLGFLEGTLGDPTAQPAGIEASLRRVKQPGSPEAHIVGTLANRSMYTLSDVRIRTRNGSAILSNSLKPNESITIDLPIRSDDTLIRWREFRARRNPRYSRVSDHSQGPVSRDVGFIYDAGDWASGRSDRIDQLLAGQSDLACIYAMTSEATPAATLKRSDGSPAIEQHFQVIRALVTLQQVDQP